MAKTYRYKVSGKVSFFVDNIVAKSPKEAKEIVTEDIGAELDAADVDGNVEILEVKVEPLRPATKKEVIDYYEE